MFWYYLRFLELFKMDSNNEIGLNYIDSNVFTQSLESNCMNSALDF